MLSFRVETPQRCYSAVVERGVIGHLAPYIPSKAGKLFVVSTVDVWRHQGEALARGLAGVAYEVLHLSGGEERKRLAPVERLAEEMVRLGGDRSSLVVAFGGGIVGDMAGFLAAVFMRGIPVLQVPTTLLAQVDASIGGKTGVNLVTGKNLIGSFHQPSWSTTNAPTRTVPNAPTTTSTQPAIRKACRPPCAWPWAYAASSAKPAISTCPGKPASIWTMWKAWASSWNWKLSCSRARARLRGRL